VIYRENGWQAICK